MLVVRLLGLLSIAIIITLVFFQIKAIIASPYVVDSLFLVKDTALMVDAISAVPGNVHYEYELSLNGMFLKTEGNQISLFRDSNETDEKLTFQTYFFTPSEMYSVSGPPEIDAALFAINKQEKNITFSSGMDAKRALEPENIDALTVSSYAKNETKIYIYPSKISSFKQDLEYFAKAIQDNLEEKNFEVVESIDKASLVIKLQTTLSENTLVQYSSQNSYETKSLSNNILAVLPEEMKPSSVPSQSGETTSQGTVFIQFGLDGQNFLKDDSNKRFVGRYVALSINKYYVGE